MQLKIKSRALFLVLQRLARRILDRPIEEWSIGVIVSTTELVDDYWRDFLSNHVDLIQSSEAQDDEYFSRNRYETAEELYMEAKG